MGAARRAGLVLAIGSIGIAVAGASVAFACSPAAYIQSGGITSGPPGTRVPVTGGAFMDTGESYGPVEIRWNSLTGTTLGSAAGPSFSVEVSVPNAAPGVYYIVAVQRTLADNSVVGKSSRAFEVTGSSASPPPSPTATPTPPPSTQQPTTENASPEAPSPGSSSEPQTAAPAPSAGAAPTKGLAPSMASPATATASPAAPSSINTAPATPITTANRSASSASTAQAVTGGSAAGSPRLAPQPSALAVPQATKASVPTAGAETAVIGQRDKVALTPDSDGPASSSGAELSRLDGSSAGSTSPSYAVGAGLMSLGLLAVFSSFFVAAVRKRRVAA